MWVEAGKASDLRPGRPRTVTISGRDVVVCRDLSGDVRALRGVCPHRGGPFGAGRIEALITAERRGAYEVDPYVAVLRCPWHGYEFDLSEGCAVADPTLRVQTYPAREEDGRILVDVPFGKRRDADGEGR